MRRSLAIVLLALSLAACGGEEPDLRLDHVVRFPGSGTTLTVSIADDDAERAQGLMGVETLPADQGLAFVWDGPVETTFWMKDTLIPLSIAFWDERGRIVSILDMAPCHEDPCPTYGPAEPFVGALEVDQGAFQRDGVQVGDHLTIADTDT